MTNEQSHVRPQETMQMVPLDESKDVGMLRRELEEELKGRLAIQKKSFS